MKTFLCFLALMVIAAESSPLNTNEQIPIVRHEQDINPDRTHSYLYETGNGIYEDQQGYPAGAESQAVQGQYQYVSPEGTVIRLSYVADENGFRPQGDHLPTPPPIPPAIQKALELLAKLPPSKDNDY